MLGHLLQKIITWSNLPSKSFVYLHKIGYAIHIVFLDFFKPFLNEGLNKLVKILVSCGRILFQTSGDHVCIVHDFLGNSRDVHLLPFNGGCNLPKVSIGISTEYLLCLQARISGAQLEHDLVVELGQLHVELVQVVLVITLLIAHKVVLADRVRSHSLQRIRVVFQSCCEVSHEVPVHLFLKKHPSLVPLRVTLLKPTGKFNNIS